VNRCPPGLGLTIVVFKDLVEIKESLAQAAVPLLEAGIEGPIVEVDVVSARSEAHVET
jgi:hypothetical protein